MQPERDGSADASTSLPSCYLICYNVSKKHNIGQTQVATGIWGRFQPGLAHMCTCHRRRRPLPPPQLAQAHLPSLPHRHAGTLARCATAFNVKQVGSMPGIAKALALLMLLASRCPAVLVPLPPAPHPPPLQQPHAAALPAHPPCSRQVCLVGSRQFNTFGAHGSSEYVDFCHYGTLDECCRDLRETKGGRAGAEAC